MGGEIWATSAGIEGEGTTMHFTLPLAPEPAENA
jgi:signal transduction histidine kinase